MPSSATENKLIYIGDPLCSWCYGFSPEVNAVKDHFKEGASFQLIMGGLRPGTKESLDEATKSYLSEHWTHVHEASGMPFDFRLLEPGSQFVYDTEVPCRAVVTMRENYPEHALEFYHEIQKAFYAENKDTNHQETYAPILNQLGVNQKVFFQAFQSDTMKQRTAQDFAMVQQWGVRGFPTLLWKDSTQLYMVTHGYAKSELMIERIEKIRKGENIT